MPFVIDRGSVDKIGNFYTHRMITQSDFKRESSLMEKIEKFYI